MRGNGGQHSHAAAMGGRRMLCQSLNAEFASKGIHVVHIVIDGAVDAPDTLGRMLGPERFQQLRETRGNEHDEARSGQELDYLPFSALTPRRGVSAPARSSRRGRRDRC